MRVLLFILLSFVGITALLSGLALVSKPDGSILGMSTSMLESTPFRNFFIPGLVLSIFVGGTGLLSIVFHLKQHRSRYNWAITSGFITSGWIIAQILLIGTVQWLHFLYLGVSVLIILIAWQLKGKWAV
jgi:hypothetical protein